MKLLLFVLTLGLSVSMGLASPGDTTRIRSHNAEHMNWYGNFDRWTVFPSNPQNYARVLLRYTLGCPSSGCSEWDYTTQVFVRKPTGVMDSTPYSHPVYTVNGQALDSLHFSFAPTYQYYWDTVNLVLDSAINTAVTVIWFQDPQNPQSPTDTITVFPAAYWNPLFDGNGVQNDSVWVAADSSIYLTFHTGYNVFEIIEQYELARLITPYAGSYSSSWKWMYTYDVTDFITLLKDSAEIRVHYSGYQDGFTATLDFEFIEGTIPAFPHKVTKLWGGGFPYGSQGNSIENYLTPKQVTISNNTARTKLIYNPTGHGFGGNENCAEFCPKNYYVKVDNNQVATRLIWRENCGLNPLYPQAGTWLYDRANWCPGAQVYHFEHDLTSLLPAGSTHTLDVDMQPFVNINNSNCSYIVEGYVIEYTSLSFTNNVAIEEIIAPNKDVNFGRVNPICNNPVVVIKNLGAAPLTSATIQYGPQGGNSQSHNWTGNLGFMQMDTVRLPLLNDWYNPGTDKIFTASVSAPNGQSDESTYDNTIHRGYNIPPMYVDSMLLVVRTNSAAYENSYKITDINGNVIFSRSNLANNTLYRDTLRLNPGCYFFQFLDTDKDGITWWANNDGAGYVRFQRVTTNTQVIKNFQQDYGTSIEHYFTVGGYVGIDEQPAPQPEIQVFPNPTSGLFQVVLPEDIKGSLSVVDMSGRIVWEQSVFPASGNLVEINLEGNPAGMYFVRYSSPKGTAVEKMILR